MDWIWEFLGDADMICPVFNLFIDPAWGLGEGWEWEAGCRQNMMV